jgi:hypothetical protein
MMADPKNMDITSDDAAIFSANTSSSFGGDSDFDTEDPTGGKIGYGNIRPQATPNRSLKSGSFPDGKLYNLTPGARLIP